MPPIGHDRRRAGRWNGGRLLAALGALALVLTAPARAQDAEDAQDDAWQVGERIAPFALEDQHGTVRHVDEATRLILFARDMDGGDLLEEALEEAPEGLLAAGDVVYVADLHRMPGLVTRLFALPSLRRRPYPMLLDLEGETTARLPGAEGRATLIHLDALRVTDVEHAASVEALRRALAAPSGAPEDTPPARADEEGDG